MEEESEEHIKIPKLELDGEFELLVFDTQQPDHTIKIGRALLISLRMKLAELLVQYKDIFPWSSVDLGIVPHSNVEYKLGIPSGTKLTFQKKRVFAKARQEVIRKEVQELLATGIIKSINFLECLSNS